MCLIFYKYISQKDTMEDKDLQDQINKKMKNGWIKSRMMMEVLAIDPKKTKEALEKHVEKMASEDSIFVYRKDFKEVIETASPYRDIPKAYSAIVELEALTKDIDTLVFIVMNYGPSSIEILEPEKMTIDAGEIQGMLVSISTMLHRFAASSGGLMIKARDKPQ